MAPAYRAKLRNKRTSQNRLRNAKSGRSTEPPVIFVRVVGRQSRLAIDDRKCDWERAERAATLSFFSPSSSAATTRKGIRFIGFLAYNFKCGRDCALDWDGARRPTSDRVQRIHTHTDTQVQHDKCIELLRKRIWLFWIYRSIRLFVMQNRAPV